MIHFIYLFKQGLFFVGVFRKPWRSWRSFVVLATTLMEDVCMQPVWLPKRPVLPKNPGWSGQGGRGSGVMICPQFSSKKIHNITTLPGKHARAEGQLDNGAFKLSEAMECRRVAGFWLFLGCTPTAGLLNGRSHVLPKYPEEKTFAGASWCNNCMLRFGFTSQVRLAVWKSIEFVCLFNSTYHATKMELWDKWCFSDKFPFPKKHFAGGKTP